MDGGVKVCEVKRKSSDCKKYVKCRDNMVMFEGCKCTDEAKGTAEMCDFCWSKYVCEDSVFFDERVGGGDSTKIICACLKCIPQMCKCVKNWRPENAKECQNPVGKWPTGFFACDGLHCSREVSLCVQNQMQQRFSYHYNRSSSGKRGM
jgi:hypothetical protein